MYEVEDELRRAQTYVRPYRCDAWDCHYNGTHWEHDYRVSVFARQREHRVPRGPCQALCSRSEYSCLKVVRWPLARAISSFLYFNHEGVNAAQKWPPFIHSNRSFYAFVAALENSTGVEPGRSTPLFGADHAWPQVNPACDFSAKHTIALVPLERLNASIASLALSKRKLAPLSAAAAIMGAGSHSTASTRSDALTWSRDPRGNLGDLAAWPHQQFHQAFGNLHAKRALIEKPPDAAFLTDAALVQRLRCLYLDDFRLYKRMCEQVQEYCPVCVLPECGSPLLLDL